MMRFSTLAPAALLLAVATPAIAQDDTAPPPAVTVTGGVTAVTDYRFRGLTQTNKDPAIQGTVNVNSSSGLYAGVWASSIDGGPDGSTPLLTNYGGAEVDLYAGFTKTLSSGLGFDIGLLYYYYPDAKGINSDFFEPYASINYTIGPINAKVGANYAWSGQSGLDFTAGDDDSLYLAADLTATIPNTPLTLKAHYGLSNGSLALANPTVADDTYADWSLTAEYVKAPFKAGVSYIDTDVTSITTPGIGNYARELGRSATVVGYVGITF